MHQAGISNAVGIMGTSLTEQQVAELQRIGGVLELCLDADRAGQAAMVRAAELAGGSKLELRVVPLPAGADPAEVIAADGPEAMRALVGASVPFVVFAVARILDGGEVHSAEGKDRVLAQLAPLLAPLAPSVLRDELTQRIAGTLELSEARLATLLAASGPGQQGMAWGSASARERSAQVPPRRAEPASGADQSVRAERTFLALCLALPQQGEAQLADIDPDVLLTSELMRRAALHLRGRCTAEDPTSGIPDGDEALAAGIRDLQDRARRGGPQQSVALEHARLLLELAHVDRAISRARAQHTPGIVKLAGDRRDIVGAIHALGLRLDQAL